MKQAVQISKSVKDHEQAVQDALEAELKAVEEAKAVEERIKKEANEELRSTNSKI